MTEYQTYTTLGHPTTIVAPEATTTLVWTGHRLDSTTTAGRTTSYAYDSAGRLSTTTLPSGLIVRNNYDTNGRIWAVDRYDSTSTHYDRTQYQFDAAGRRTQVSVRRVTTGGTLVSQAGFLAATYEDHGFLRTSTLGPQLPTTFTYDSNGSGDLDSLLRGDGDQELFVTDPRGREQTLTRYFTSTTTGTSTLGYTEPSGNQQGGTLPTTVTDAASRTRTYRYDDFDHLIRSTSPEYGTQWWEWINDRITRTKLNANLATVYTYDDLGRVTLMDNNNGSAVVGPDYSFTYQNTTASPTGVAPVAAELRVTAPS